MNKKVSKIIVLTIAAIFGVGSMAFAGWGYGCDYDYGMGRGNYGAGWNHGGGHGYGQGQYYGNLSNEEIAKIDQQRAEFFKATENSRQKLYENELALQSELAKENPDTGKASNLQGEISRLQSDLDQKRLDYEFRARKSAPNYDQGRRGYGPMMGYNSPRGGYCSW